MFYDDVSALRACIAALERQDGPGFEIIVVDNRGEPVLGAMLSDSERGRLLSPGENLGYGAGNNLAATAARGHRRSRPPPLAANTC